MIIDSFLYAGEEDLLRLRMETLGSVVDRFVALESGETIQGDKRQQSITDQCEVVWTPHLYGETPHLREDYQRDSVLHIDAAPTDILLMGDVDEIPHPDTVADLALSCDLTHGFALMAVEAYYWAIDWYSGPQYQTAACSFGMAHPSLMRPKGGHFIPGAQHYHTWDRGWHFSWLGDPKAWHKKMDTFSHPEAKWMLEGDPARWWRDGWHYNGVESYKLTPVEIDDTYPEPIVSGSFEVPAIWRRPR